MEGTICEICGAERKRVVIDKYTCNSKECIEKAKDGRVGMGISRTKFGVEA